MVFFYKKNKGFTLIELLVVVAIIGILSSVVLASLNTARAKGRTTKATAEMKQIHIAAEMDYDVNGNYAPDTGSGGSPRFVPTFFRNWDATYYCANCQYDYNNWLSGTGGSTGSECILVTLRDSVTAVTYRQHIINNATCPGNIEI